MDAALRDLEDRGLLWWDRSSNSYDMHPIVRAYVHEQLDAGDRIQANERVRDHFQALPPERADAATSVEDLRRTITIFRALAGADQHAEACALWEWSLSYILRYRFGAYATVSELLFPLAGYDALVVSRDLSETQGMLGHHDESIGTASSAVAHAVRAKRPDETRMALQWLGGSLIDSGALAGFARSVDLRQQLAEALGTSPNAWLLADMARCTGMRGDVEHTFALLDEAEAAGRVVGDNLVLGDLRVQRLAFAYDVGEPISERDLGAAEVALDNWTNRHDLQVLRVQLLLSRGQLEQTLCAAHDLEQMERDAGAETTAAASAAVLAMLGRRAEATAALEQALARLPRLHLADRPHIWLAEAMLALGQLDEAAEHARIAYGQAWGDGPPHSHHWQVRRVRDLLERIGVAPPELPTVLPASVHMPMEREVRAFIAKLAG